MNKNNKIILTITIIILSIIGIKFIIEFHDMNQENAKILENNTSTEILEQQLEDLVNDKTENNSNKKKKNEKENKTDTDEIVEMLGGINKIKNSVVDVTYEQLARNPKTYLYNPVHFKGQVVQVVRDGSFVCLRLNTKLSSYDNSYYDDDTLFLMIEKEDSNNRILEKDIIDFYGISNDIYTYESTFGTEVSLPSILVVEYKITK